MITALGALIIPILACLIGLDILPAKVLFFLFLSIYLSEAVVFLLRITDHLPSFLLLPRYSTDEARKLREPRSLKRWKNACMVLHTALFFAAAGIVIHQIACTTIFSANYWQLCLVLTVLSVHSLILAHELSHSRHLRPLATGIHTFIGSIDGMINHLGHHHLWYGTEKDHLSREFEAYYYGVLRRIAFQWKNAQSINKRLLLTSNALHVGILVACYLFFGSGVLLALLISTISVRIFAESLNVFSHYQVMRSPTSATATAAWDVDTHSLFAFFGGYGIVHHPAHHLGSLPVCLAGTPVLPGFLSAATLCYLCPPVFRRLMDLSKETGFTARYTYSIP